MDQKILRTMIEMYGGPVGLNTLSVNIAEERETVEDMYEPYLIQQGFLMRTRTGRLRQPRLTSTWVIPIRKNNGRADEPYS